jgi:peptide-methionine (S)-S-oxide reductase
MTKKHETATLAAGCFWCVEAVFSRLRGVAQVSSGYAGGTLSHPDYLEVCGGTTGHAEAVQIMFDPDEISFAELLEVFWRSHDPTTPDRQGADVGSQYRSVIFYHDENQHQVAEHSKREAEAAGLWPDPIVTSIVSFTNFYLAERHHQDFYRLNPDEFYCRMVIDPKIKKLQKEFAAMLKSPAP